VQSVGAQLLVLGAIAAIAVLALVRAHRVRAGG
jgi:hypothetical protein